MTFIAISYTPICSYQYILLFAHIDIYSYLLIPIYTPIRSYPISIYTPICPYQYILLFAHIPYRYILLFAHINRYSYLLMSHIDIYSYLPVSIYTPICPYQYILLFAHIPYQYILLFAHINIYSYFPKTDLRKASDKVISSSSSSPTSIKGANAYLKIFKKLCGLPGADLGYLKGGWPGLW